MKTKICAQCNRADILLYRIQIEKGKTWIFVCTACCIEAKKQPGYRYGGTWKGFW